MKNLYGGVTMTKIEFLKELAKGWFGNSQQHSIHAQLLKGRGLNKLADKIMAESDEEWEEAKKVNARLIELGEIPVVELQEYPIITDIKEMLEYDCKDAAEALPMMSKALSMFDDDYVTKHMIQEFIVGEQDHFNWVKQHLYLIEQIGLENYMIEMLGD
jgi:bacterioferritin